MHKVTFKQYHTFVEAPDDLSEEQLTEIFGKFFGKNPDKMQELQAKKDDLKKQADAKKKEIGKAKDAAWANAKQQAERPGQTSPLMSRSMAGMRAGARGPFGMQFEGAMDEVHAEIEDLWPHLESGKIDLYDVLAMNKNDTSKLSKEARNYLQHRADSIAQSKRLHPDDDFDEIIGVMMDELEAEYGK